jgi:hypothetical protein
LVPAWIHQALEPPLKNLVSAFGRQSAGFLVAGLLLLVTPRDLTGQGTDSYDRSPARELPRFTLCQIVTGSNDTLRRIRGAWLQAALEAHPESLTRARYHAVSELSGVAALEPKALESERFQHTMGLYRREELTRATARTLEAIRSSIPNDTTRARFDRIFRSRGTWIVDLHDAALEWTQLRSSGMTWSKARSALAAVRWLDPKDSLTSEAVPRATYGLMLLGSTDSAALAGIESDMVKADPVSAEAVKLLLAGYADGRRWYADALGFFVSQRWIPDSPQGQSLAGLVHREWRLLTGDPASAGLKVPAIRTHVCGYPQAVPQYGVPAGLFGRLNSPDNATARLWLQRHGQAALLQAVGWLPPGDTSLVVLQVGAETIRLMTAPRQSRESLNGFLKPADAIAIDPGYSPLLAMGAVVHEWQHLHFRRRQLEAFAQSLAPEPLAFLEIPGVEPFLAEGFAEWTAERILEPLERRWPLLAMGGLEKRAGLLKNGAEDQHSTGYALVATLAAALKDPTRTVRLLLSHAQRPAEIARLPELRRAWRKYSRERDRVLPVPPGRILIPEVTFTVEDGHPDVVASRILLPVKRRPAR